MFVVGCAGCDGVLILLECDAHHMITQIHATCLFIPFLHMILRIIRHTQTETFMHEATSFFLLENLPRFICGEDLLNLVDCKAGY